LRVGRGDEAEVGPGLEFGGVVENEWERGVACVDGVRGGDDGTLAFLAVNRGEPRNWERVAYFCAGGDEIVEDVACADAGELVGVADKE